MITPLKNFALIIFRVLTHHTNTYDSSSSDCDEVYPFGHNSPMFLRFRGK